MRVAREVGQRRANQSRGWSEIFSLFLEEHRPSWSLSGTRGNMLNASMNRIIVMVESREQMSDERLGMLAGYC